VRLDVIALTVLPGHQLNSLLLSLCEKTHYAFLQIVAIRPLLVRLVPASTISPRRANSPRLGLTVLAFISSSFVISSSVLGVRHRNS
jgi:hypothetical protein